MYTYVRAVKNTKTGKTIVSRIVSDRPLKNVESGTSLAIPDNWYYEHSVQPEGYPGEDNDDIDVMS